MNATNTIVVILAAGAGNRMGVPKWKLPFNSERNFLEHLVFTYSCAGFNRIAVVMTQEESEEFEGTATARKCKMVINNQPRSGRNHSVGLGLAAFGQYGFAFIQNVDNPFTTPELIIEMWHGRLSDGFVVPAFEGKPGHPVLLGGLLCREFLRHKTPDLHFRTWLYSFPKRAIETRSPRILQNINTPDDLKEAITEFSLPEKFKSVQDTENLP